MKIQRPTRPQRFRPADSAQQMVGGFLLAGPFVVTEEVWVLAGNMTVFQALATVGIVLAIGYATLYKADAGRDVDSERDIGRVPVRFISLMIVSFGSVAILALLFDAPETFLSTTKSGVETIQTTAKAISISSIFSVVGAATADSVFSK